MARHAVEPIPGRLRRELRMAGATDALVASHFPADEHQAEAARERLAFEELFLYQAALVSRRGRRVSGAKGHRAAAGRRRSRGLARVAALRADRDQRRAIEEIDSDLGRAQPMQRLLMGEVGSGKTVLALYAMLRAIEAGHQAALMAPTETLAEQHFRTLETLLASEAAPATLLTSATPPPSAASCSTRSPSGQPQLVVGTHALIEDAVEFASLAVAVVDEQHRFGVRQRAALDAKGPGQAAASRPPHDGDADPADPFADRVRRPRHHRAARAAQGPPADPDQGRRRGPSGGRLRVHPRAPARGAPGLRRLPAGQRVGADRGTRRRG